jgi:hypothetical protein
MTIETDSVDRDKCPFCRSPKKATVPERAVRPIGQKGAGHMVEVGQREEFHCGAVKLTNSSYPNGTIEAKCCSPARAT